ncbi:MAG: hypothetical protein LQ348_000032 [Seirophora lacunosa]|nr:MAG: hypothetical protein LQ348_000032 [Seirophora lacunosa]
MNNSSAPAGGDNRDYLDKALDAAQKKIPGKAGDRFRDPNSAQKNRAMNEKITDFMRKQFEKITGCVSALNVIQPFHGL